MYSAIDTLIRIILYSCVGVGILLFFGDLWGALFNRGKQIYYGINHRRLLRVSAGFRTNTKSAYPLLLKVNRHLEILLQTTMKKKKAQNVLNFASFSLILAAVTFLLSFSFVKNFGLALMPTVFMLFAPYGLLNIRKYHIGIQNSYDFPTLIDILVPEYRKKHKSMVHALSSTLEHMPRTPLRRAVAFLVDRLTDYSSKEEVTEALDRFISQLGTTWAIPLADDIEHALIDGIDVEVSLSSLHTELKDIQDATKGQNLVRLDSLLISILPFFVWPIIMFYFYFKVTRNTFAYQFNDPAGFRWFILTLLCTFGSLLIGVIFYRPKQDI